MRSRRLALALAILGCVWLVACSDNTHPATEPGAVLTRRDPEPAGGNCTHGGVAIRIGHDTNGDGVLADGEVEQTQYVCDAPSTELIRKDPIAPDAQCPSGGTAVNVGVDDNGDGVLQDSEIDQTTIVCDSSEIWTGDFTVGDWSDPVKVAALEGARVVTGSLTTAGDGDVSLPLLEIVNGNLTAQGDLTGLELPKLRQVGGAFDADLPGVTALSFAALERVVGDAAFTRNGASGVTSLPALHDVGGAVKLGGALTALQAGALATIGGALTIDDLTLAHLSLPALATIGGDLDTNSDQVLATIDLPALSKLGGKVYILSNPALTTVTLTALAHVGGDLDLDQLALVTSVDLTGLVQVDGMMFVDGTPKLVSLPLPALTTVGHGGLNNGESILIAETGLTTFAAPQLTTASAEVALNKNAALTSATFAKLDGAATALAFTLDPALATVSAPAATHLLGLFVIESGHPTLAFPKLASLAGTLQLQDVTLDDLAGFPALASVSLFDINHVAGLTDLAGLTALTHVASLDLDADPALATLDGLDQITQLTGDFTLSGDEALTSIAGLAHLQVVGGSVTIFDLPKVPPADLAALHQRLGK